MLEIYGFNILVTFLWPVHTFLAIKSYKNEPERFKKTCRAFVLKPNRNCLILPAIALATSIALFVYVYKAVVTQSQPNKRFYDYWGVIGVVILIVAGLGDPYPLDYYFMGPYLLMLSFLALTLTIVLDCIPL